ncbi:uncharacterized protein LOC126681727 [Mercurialis annua]|uniref:uncharacterized protein LOC126681727 n=1 Tax=Mercurialis annua TaxID=3986 RepID=UPI00215FBF7D|nr:uncharacterized protein LOC126681727 [Mercurialis annua]
MDSEDDFTLQFSDSENQQPSPLPQRKLKRLRRSTHIIPKHNLPNQSSEDNEPSSPSFHDVNSNSSKSEDLEEETKSDGENIEELDAGLDESQFEGFKVGIDGLDEQNRTGARRTLEFEPVAEEFDTEDEDLAAYDVEIQNEEVRADLGLDLAPGKKRRTNLGESEEKKKERKKKKRAKKNSDDGFDGINLYSAASTKKMRDKERRERIKNLSCESQRLLRESRDASFKPVPSVQKSVSSVLEKIRKRKHELSMKNSSVDGNGASLSVFEEFPSKNTGHRVIDADSEETTMCSVEVVGILGAQTALGSKEASNDSHKNATSQTALGEGSKQTFRAPVDDTQDLDFDSQTSDSKDELIDDLPSSPLEDVMAPSLLAMNLKLDSAPPDDFSSDEEDNDKENIDPYLQGLAESPSSRIVDPMRAFVDDEAEEEDDSDNDLARFKDDDEDEDIMDPEELNDIIATGYEEKPMDNEMRNQLHQKWLEQQDAAGTEKLMQKLKCNSKQIEMSLTDEEEDEESEEVDEEFLDNPAENFVSRNAVRMNLRKAKEMICQMFTDNNDVYVSSDDEETEERFAKQHLSDKTVEQAKFLSPAEDEGSKDIFGLIKKLNSEPDTRRRAKITSHFHALTIGGNKTASSMSSFVSRRSRSSLPSFQKNGSSTVRSFIFERDDSNSRSAITMSKDSLDSAERENRPKKSASAKYSSSQVRSSSQNTETIAEKSSGPSLHEILRYQSLQSSHISRGSMASQVEAIYASFKLDPNLVKKERASSIRTA